MKEIKSLRLIFLMVIMLSTPIISLASAPWETYDYSRFNNETFLYDNAGLISSAVFEEYSIVLAEMQQEFGITYVFVLTDGYDGPAQELADYIWEFGGFDMDYISVVISLASRDFAVDTYGRGIDIMSDRYVTGMLDTLEASLSAGNFNQALIDFADLAAKMTESYLEHTFSVTTRDGTVIFRTDAAAREAARIEFTFMEGLLAVLGAFAVGGALTSLIATAVVIQKHRPVKAAARANMRIEPKDMRMDTKEDVFLRTFTRRIRIPRQDPMSGGGGTRGSTFSGSSGRMRGGGSRGF